ncbi:Hypothetical predicted protein [Octopus vulgaris]|uniref:28S ribosomal protein S27, mitochondrial n=1 Tax=Octopus vulgaris TaxID=6645 RepID=A0AA36AK66_OCTVU|nr:Hypothetical predicted protein [Octopus vulgaris]
MFCSLSVMAQPCVLRSLYRSIKRSSQIFPGLNFSVCRHLLSDAYQCQTKWEERMNSQELQVPCNDFLYKLAEKAEKEKNISFVDIDILANKVDELEASDIKKVEKLLYRFRHSVDAANITDSLATSLARGYLKLGLAENYLSLMKKKIAYGIFPDFPTSNILMDHFIKTGKYGCAAQIAYEMMLQEDFSHRSTLLLSLYSCVKFLLSLPKQSKACEDVQEEKAEVEVEEIWVKVKYMNKPYYDDHFDITEPQLLLGKTLIMIGKELSDHNLLSCSLQTYGFALYEKFNKGLLFLEKLLAGPKVPCLYKSALEKFQECLEFCKVKDPNLAKKELGLLRKHDSREEIRLSAEEKELHLDKFKTLFEQLTAGGYVVENCDQFEKEVDSIVNTELPALEQADIDQQVSNFSLWTKERSRLLQEQIDAYQRAAKRKEIETKLLEIQEKEEILTFFERKHELQLAVLIGEKKQGQISPSLSKEKSLEDELIYDEQFKKTKEPSKKKKR